MSSFLTPLIVSPLNDGVHWEIFSSLHYQDDELGLIIVPVGFLTDGGSIPRLFQNVISPTGKGFRAFIVHDNLYATQQFTRLKSDECLKRALKVCGENWLEDDVQFDAVRIGGQKAWEEDQIKYNLKRGS